MALSEFDNPLVSAENEVLENASMLNDICSRIEEDRFTSDQLFSLVCLLDDKGLLKTEGGQEYGANFDLGLEIDAQLKAIRAMRESIIVNGKIKEGVAPREVKEVVSTANSMFTTLMKHHREVQSMDRQRILESTTIECLQEVDEKVSARFFEIFNEKLEALDT